MISTKTVVSTQYNYQSYHNYHHNYYMILNDDVVDNDDDAGDDNDLTFYHEGHTLIQCTYLR